MITKFGKRFITSYLANQVSFSKQDIAIGIDSTTPNVSGNDTKLGFEFYRLPVSFGGIDIQTTGGVSTYSVLYKTTIPQDVAGVIKEVGLYPATRTSVNNFDSKFLADFEDNTKWTRVVSGVTYYPDLVTTPTPRIGASMSLVNCPASSTREYFNTIVPLDISGYSGNDSLSLAINQGDLNLDYINIRFYSSDTDYHQISFDGADIDTGTGEKILSRSWSTLQAVNSPSNIILKISILVAAKAGGTTNVYFDGIRMNDEDTFDPTFGLIARSTITPITKVAGKPLDLEYKIGLNF